ncbi:hypothetical protein EON65_23425 [archaeon]|nr:MAG: hypothetical protein EON65_23425 [archaeon]
MLPSDFQELPYSFCLYLTVDGTVAQFVEFNVTHCPFLFSNASIADASANVIIRYGEYLGLSNAQLHQWYLAAANIGLSYCGSGSCVQTSFQEILADASNSSEPDSAQVFGLDFQDPSGSSTMQLAGVKEEYVDTLQWYTSSTKYPPFHQVMISELSICGAPLLGNYSSTWEVLVDTGSVCLTLPAEIYDNFAAWFKNSTVVNSYEDLPALSFTVFGSPSDRLYIPLSAMVVNESAVENETGAPTVYSTTQGRSRICVLRGSNIVDSFGDYSVPPPQISFGSLVLRAFYFAADFNSFSTGLATKLTADQIAYYSNTSNPSCAAMQSCVGKQGYFPSDNSCRAPQCSEYYFMNTNTDNTHCEYDQGAVGFGIFFICLIVLLEVLSFFSNQYTAYALLQSRQNTNVYVDSVTLMIGRYLSYVVDSMAMKIYGDERRQRLAEDRNALLHAA